MKLEINDSEIIEHRALITEDDEIEIRINGKKIFIGILDNIDSDIETIIGAEDYVLFNRKIQPIKINKIKFIIKATKQE